MKRCKRCVMPETVPGTIFDKDGICSLCLSYKKETCLPEKDLERVIAATKNKHNTYDCIVPLSGGRDSTFVLYTARARYDLKVLAVNYDNEFRTDQAVINMRNACKLLNVDFVSVRSKRDIAQKIVRYGIQSALPLGLYACLSVICRACNYGYKSVPYRAAQKYKVPLILWGESQGEATRHTERKALQEVGRSRFAKFLKLLNINFYKAEYCSLLQRAEFHVPGNSILSRRPRPACKIEGVKEIRLFDYIPWDRKQIKETITSQLAWEKPPGHVSSWRTDCTLHDLVNYCFYSLLGCSKECFGYCNMINDGQMSRADALRQEEQTPTMVVRNIGELLRDKIGLSKKDVARIESLQGKIDTMLSR